MQYTHIVDESKCYYYISYGTNSLLLNQVSAKDTLPQLLTLVNTTYINPALFSHLAATQKANSRRNIKLYFLEKSR